MIRISFVLCSMKLRYGTTVFPLETMFSHRSLPGVSNRAKSNRKPIELNRTIGVQFDWVRQSNMSKYYSQYYFQILLQLQLVLLPTLICATRDPGTGGRMKVRVMSARTHENEKSCIFILFTKN